MPKDVLVTFADFENGLDEVSKKHYQQINELINTIDDSTSVANADLKSLLVQLRNSLGDKNTQRASVTQIEQFLSEKECKLTAQQETDLRLLINDLSDYVTLSAKGAGTYEIAKEEILSLLPLSLKKKILNGFTMFEEVENRSSIDVQEERRKILETISATISANIAKSDKNIGEDEIANEDFQETVKPNLCKIANDYSIATKLCNEYNKGNTDYKPILENTNTQESEKNGFPIWLKVLLWIVGIVVVAFVGTIIAFAIKAKLRERIESEDS